MLVTCLGSTHAFGSSACTQCRPCNAVIAQVTGFLSPTWRPGWSFQLPAWLVLTPGHHGHLGSENTDGSSFSPLSNTKKLTIHKKIKQDRADIMEQWVKLSFATKFGLCFQPSFLRMHLLVPQVRGSGHPRQDPDKVAAS